MCDLEAGAGSAGVREAGGLHKLGVGSGERGTCSACIQNDSMRFDAICCDWLADLATLNAGDVANFLIGVTEA